MMDLILQYMPLISLVASAIFGLILYTMRHAFVSIQTYQTDQKIQIKTNNGFDKRISALETAIHNQPSADDFHELAISNVRLEEQMKAITLTLKSVNRQLSVMDTYLRKDDKK